MIRALVAETKQGNRHPRLVFLAIFLSGISLRLYNLHLPQLWMDEIIQLVTFSQPTLRDNLHLLSTQVATAPLDYLIQSVFVSLWGAEEFGARFHAALFGCLTLPCFFALAQQLLGRSSAALATFLLATYPLHISYSQEGRNYSLFCFLTVVSFLLLTVALQNNRWTWWSLFSLSTLLLLYTNYLAQLVLGTQTMIVLGLLWLRSTSDKPWDLRKRRLWRFVVSGYGAFALFVPWLVLTVGQAHLNAYEQFPLPRFVVLFLKEFSGGSLPLSLILLLLAGLGFRDLCVRPNKNAAWLLGCWLVLFIGSVIFVDWWRGYFFAIRQVLVAAPAMLLFSAAGLDSLFRSAAPGRRKSALLLLVGISLLSIGTLIFSDRKPHADWKGLDHYLKKEVKETDLVWAPQIVGIIAFRSPKIHEKSIPREHLIPWVSGQKSKTVPTSVPRKRRVHVVISRYIGPRERKDVEEILHILNARRSLQLPGFEIWVLRLSGDSPAKVDLIES